MVKQLIAFVFAAFVIPAQAALPVRTLYNDALAKEQAVRGALNDQADSESVLKAVRTVVAAYESLVRRYPNSSYCDDALWRAARLSLDAFDRYGQPRDQEAGRRLLRRLGTEYPTSKLAKAGVASEVGEVGPALHAASRADTSPVPSDPAKSRVAPSTPAPEVTATRGVEPLAVKKVATISGIRRVVLADVVRVIVDVDAEVPFHEERIPGPSRIFVDLQSTRTAESLMDQTLRFDRDNDVVRQVRIGRHPNTTTRVVLDAAGVSSYSVYPLYSPYRLVIDCVRETPNVRQASSSPTPSAAAAVTAPTSSRQPTVRQDMPAGDLQSRRVTVPAGRLPPAAAPASAAMADARALPLASRALGNRSARLPGGAPGATAALQNAYPNPLLARTVAPPFGRGLPSVNSSGVPTIVAADNTEAVGRSGSQAPPPPPPPITATPTVPTVNAPNLGGAGFSMARQLGLGVSRIVIDPGHGGHDPGAKGKGATEAELVLDVALRLEKLLQATHRFEVLLTRRTDDFIALPERTAMANREGADLFLSIHANASPNVQAHGVETYFLNFASNMSAAAVAARENAGSGQAMGALPDFVKAIALNNKLDESRDFATHVQRSMIDQLRGANKSIKDLGVKQAPFVVLIGASMPSVLAEISFLTNTQELKLLKSHPYRQRIAEALSSAIAKYQTSLTRTKAVAQQQ
jgi:N-acetylmuramoyl-L-alanine amidase